MPRRPLRVAVECELLGWPADGPTLRLDHERFSYAGKFVMSSTGKAVGRSLGEGERRDATTEEHPSDPSAVVAAVAFSEDRTDPSVLWLRYVTVRADRRGEGLAPELVEFVAGRADERGYDRLRIAVNNPYAYEALHRAGFGFAGRTTGLAEVVLERPAEGSAASYRAGLRALNDRADRSADERAFVAEKLERGPPDRDR